MALMQRKATVNSVYIDVFVKILEVLKVPRHATSVIVISRYTRLHAATCRYTPLQAVL